jgi:hypothetical protein
MDKTSHMERTVTLQVFNTPLLHHSITPGLLPLAQSMVSDLAEKARIPLPDDHHPTRVITD